MLQRQTNAAASIYFYRQPASFTTLLIKAVFVLRFASHLWSYGGKKEKEEPLPWQLVQLYQRLKAAFDEANCFSAFNT